MTINDGKLMKRENRFQNKGIDNNRPIEDIFQNISLTVIIEGAKENKRTKPTLVQNTQSSDTLYALHAGSISYFHHLYFEERTYKTRIHFYKLLTWLDRLLKTF